MAFSKTAGIGGLPGVIVFSYETTSLFNNVSLQSTYMTKELMGKDGRNIGEQYAMSEDEIDAFNVSLDIIMSDIFEIFLKLTNGITDAYVIDATTVSISIQDHTSYNDNVLKLVDMAIKECVQSGCLKGWFETCSQMELFKIAVDRYFMAQEILKRRLFQLKKKRTLTTPV